MSHEHPLDGLLNDMLYPAVMLVGAVRARDPEGVSAVIRDQSRAELCALLVAVACLVPDDQTVGQLTLWTHGPDVTDEVYGQLVLDELAGRAPEHHASKRCTRCERYRPLTDFHRGTVHNKGGRKAQCKDCIAEARRVRIAASDTNRSAAASSSPDSSGEAVAA
jgi:hypothetical protein